MYSIIFCTMMPLILYSQRLPLSVGGVGGACRWSTGQVRDTASA